MSGFWAMGGYAAYVWPAYALFLLVLLLDTLLPRWRQRRLLAETRAQVVREHSRRQRGAAPLSPGPAHESHP
ncbi:MULTISPECIES: heme exporter protein CcmD [Xanthomonas]|jgi:heme exporter protein D|uniref:heme exporter protein CcmD n=2 Tax=Xanthomonas TaxID=338 RepID=UPI0015C8550F|nr:MULTISPECIES: heme exporter protein CcmD [Xanthomonas]MBD7920800.1 heme exporter protein CcmD [Xanthomonas surreyensis]NYF19358.1 heme exporter protein D [Xanthomonas sp. JAI131]